MCNTIINLNITNKINSKQYQLPKFFFLTEKECCTGYNVYDVHLCHCLVFLTKLNNRKTESTNLFFCHSI